MRRLMWRLVVMAVVAVVAACGSQSHESRDTLPPGLPLKPVGEIRLPGDNSRFASASLDEKRGLLFVAHLGASEVVEVDVNTQQVVRTIPNLASVHGVLVVGALGRVYATATRGNQLVAIDEATGRELGRTVTGDYPDELAYDSRRGAIWTANVNAGTATVIDANTLQVRGTAEVGGEIGDIGYDSSSDRMMVAAQGRNDLAVIDPPTMAVVQRVQLPGCDHPHGLAIDESDRLVFVACDLNATLLTIDESNWRVVGTDPVGQGPDELAYDPGSRRLYVAAESGILAILVLRDHNVAVIRSGHLADDAHVVVVDPNTHRSYFPAPGGPHGPVLLVREAT
jgi:DNA-binding beta-propeller fold protein YncE